MDDLIAQLMLYDWGGDRGALAGIDQHIIEANGDRDALKVIERGLLDVVQSDAAVPAKEYACRQLALIGTAQSVRVLAGMLDDPELSDCARFALEAIPGGGTDRALRRALEKTDGVQRVGIVNSLGERHDRRAKRRLTKLRNHADTQLAGALDAALRKMDTDAER